jgi:hypothetical protein
MNLLIVAILASFTFGAHSAFADSDVSASASSLTLQWDRLNPEQRMQMVGANISFNIAADEVVQNLNSTPNKVNCERPMLKKETILIYIAFGYQNGELSMTEDIATLNALEELLTRRCTAHDKKNNIQLCGFQTTNTSAPALTKTIVRNDSTSQKIQIQLRGSSFTPYDYDNQTLYKDQQIAKSALAQDKFLLALTTHDVVLYIGHSRDGGGPDFYPPVLLPEFANEPAVEGDMVDYSHYAKNPQGILSMLDTLNNSPKHASVIGLFSCSSAMHFYKQISRFTAPKTQLLTTTQATEKSFEAMLVGLNGVLTGQCDQALNAEMSSYDGRVQRTKK